MLPGQATAEEGGNVMAMSGEAMAFLNMARK